MENFLHLAMSLVIAGLIAAAIIYIAYAVVDYMERRPLRQADIQHIPDQEAQDALS